MALNTYKWGEVDNVTLETLTTASTTDNTVTGITTPYTTDYTWGTATTATIALPTYNEFDSDYDTDTQNTEDPLKIMKRLARGCYKGNSCIKCNNKRIIKAFYEKYGYGTSTTDWTNVTIPYITAPVNTTSIWTYQITTDNTDGT